MHILTEKYIPVIGLEVHARLQTKAKLFCGCPAEYGKPPNTNVCPVCLGHPGTLPVINRKAVEFIISMGVACGCRINRKFIFARKNYYYPDLPKGYQISQFEIPICECGTFLVTDTKGNTKDIRIRSIHLEEDAGKLIHMVDGKSAVDYNRCGVPLIEIVTEPDISSPLEAYKFLVSIKQILNYLDICDVNMEEGSLRCDANISLKSSITDIAGTKTELKNLNSFRNVEKALSFEITRQAGLLNDGIKVSAETMLWDPETNSCIPTRTKEQELDYRYFPEPDLIETEISEIEIEGIKRNLPELPSEKIKRFKTRYNLPDYDLRILTYDREVADYFEEVAAHTGDYKTASNWVMGQILAARKERGNSVLFPVKPDYLAELINLINSGELNNRIAKKIFSRMITEGGKPSVIAKEMNLHQVSDYYAISRMIEDVISSNPKEINKYLSGKENLFGYFIGQVMKISGGKADPSIVNNILTKKLEHLKTNNFQE